VTENGPSPREVAREALNRLQSLADPVKARGAERYFKETVKCFGVRAPEIHALAAGLYGRIKGNWTADRAVELCDILFPRPELEAKAVGALILDRFNKDLGPGFFAKAKGWLAGDLLDNWASVDTFCTQTMGAFLERRPAFVERIKAWSFHRNRWVKRASLVSFIKPAKKAVR